MKQTLKPTIFSAILITALAFVTAGPAFAIPYCSSTESVNCGKYGIGGKDCHQIDGARGTECVDVSQKGLDIIQSTERDDRGGRDRRDRRDQAYETCPSGFQPSENKCTPEERRRGCKDMRLPGGLGCVHR